MKNNKKILVLLPVLAMILSLLAGCGDSSDTSGTKVVKAGTIAPYGSFLVSSSDDPNDWSMHLIYDFILEYDTDANEWTSKTLESWEWTDHVTLKLVLKDDIYFSDGTHLTGEDILYTLQSHVINGHPEVNYFKLIDYNASYVSDNGLTTYVVYKETYGAALATLQIPIMCKALCEEHPDGDEIWYSGAVGSGPYKVAEAVTDSYVKYTKRDDYWNIDNYNYEPDEIYVHYYTDNTAMFADYQAGNINIALDLTSTEYDQLLAGKVADTEAVMMPDYDVGFVIINDDSVFGSNPAIREALYYAVDWYACAQVGNGSLCTAATSHFDSHFPAYMEHTSAYDPDKARQVLEEAGYSDGDVALLLVCMNMGHQDKMAEAIQGYASEVGIAITVEVYDPATIFTYFISGEADITFQGLAASGGNPSMEPDQALSALKENSFTIMAINDEEFNELLDESLATTDQDLRTEIYKQVDQWLYDNFLAYPLCESYQAYCYKTDVFKTCDLILFSRDAYLCNVTFN